LVTFQQTRCGAGACLHSATYYVAPLDDRMVRRIRAGWARRLAVRKAEGLYTAGGRTIVSHYPSLCHATAVFHVDTRVGLHAADATLRVCGALPSRSQIFIPTIPVTSIRDGHAGGRDDRRAVRAPGGRAFPPDWRRFVATFDTCYYSAVHSSPPNSYLLSIKFVFLF